MPGSHCHVRGRDVRGTRPQVTGEASARPLADELGRRPRRPRRRATAADAAAFDAEALGGVGQGAPGVRAADLG